VSAADPDRGGVGTDADSGTGASTEAGAEAIARLADRESIRAELDAYFDALGRRDWERIADGFTTDARLDYGTPGVRDVEGNLTLLRTGVERLTLVSTLLGVQARVRTSGNEAVSETSAFTAHLASGPGPQRLRVSFVRYKDAWRRCADGRWRVRERIVHPDLKGWLEPRGPDFAATGARCGQEEKDGARHDD
jgi:ketosteroid isomerase-like protein